MNGCSTNDNLFARLFAARCSCCSETYKRTCSETAWLNRAQRFVQSYLPALLQAREAAPTSAAWWSCSSAREPVPSLREYFELLERTAGVSESAREKMAQYLERELPAFDKALGCDQGMRCSDQYQYRAMIAANPPPQPTRLPSPGFHSGAPCLAAPPPGVEGAAGSDQTHK